MAVSLIEKVSYVTWNQEMVNHVFFGANCIEEITRKVELGCCLLRAIEPKSFKVIVVVDFQPCQDHDTYHAASEVPEAANPYSASKCIMPTSSTWAQEESLGFRPATPPEPRPNGAFQTTRDFSLQNKCPLRWLPLLLRQLIRNVIFANCGIGCSPWSPFTLQASHNLGSRDNTTAKKLVTNKDGLFYISIQITRREQNSYKNLQIYSSTSYG